MGSHKGLDEVDCLETSLGIKMITIPSGSFDMGSNKKTSESPIHKVTLSRFELSSTPITQGQYEAVMGMNPSKFIGKVDSSDRPVEQVSWYDAIRFCNKMSERFGRAPVYKIEEGSDTDVSRIDGADGFRLPTEAEWEYAARGEEEFTYASSNRAEDVGWIGTNSKRGTHPVRCKSSNGYGLFDMTGNVWEWVSDWYDSDYYGRSPKRDPENTTPNSFRTFRGGSWFREASFARVANRYGFTPDGKFFNLGFRIARSHKEID